MTVVQLECVLEAARQQNFSKAAANLYLSQPTLSRHIQALEQELRVPIFDRTNKSVRLTEAGRALLPKLERMSVMFRTATAELHEIADHITGQLKIGVLATLWTDGAVRQAIHRFRQEYPEVTLNLCHLTIQDSYAALMDGSVDILLSLGTVMPPSDKTCFLRLPEERMCLAVPAQHPNAGLADIMPKEISTYFSDLKFCLLDIDEFAPPVQGGLKTVYTDCADIEIGAMSDLDTLIMLVDAGLGITYMNENCILRHDPHVKMIPLVEKRKKSGPVYMQSLPSLYWLPSNTNTNLNAFLELVSRESE